MRAQNWGSWIFGRRTFTAVGLLMSECVNSTVAPPITWLRHAEDWDEDNWNSAKICDNLVTAAVDLSITPHDDDAHSGSVHMDNSWIPTVSVTDEVSRLNNLSADIDSFAVFARTCIDM